MVPILRYSGYLELPGSEKCKALSVEEAKQHPTVRGLPEPQVKLQHLLPYSLLPDKSFPAQPHLGQVSSLWGTLWL